MFSFIPTAVTKKSWQKALLCIYLEHAKLCLHKTYVPCVFVHVPNLDTL